MGREAQLTA